MNTQVDRGLIIKLLVVVALVLFAVWIMNSTYWAEQTIPKPLSGEAVTNPFYSVQHLSDALGAHSEWKHLLGDLPPTNAVIVLGYWNWDVIAKRREQLQQWVRDGGRLVADETLVIEDASLKEWAGLEYHNVQSKYSHDSDDEDGSDKETDQQDKNKVVEDHHLDQHGDACNNLNLVSSELEENIKRSTYRLCNYDWERFITSAHPIAWGLRDSHGFQMVSVVIGKGRLSLFNGMPFQNRQLLKADHGLLFVAATQLHRGDAIYFLMDEKGTSLLKLIWIYGAPVVTLTLLLVTAALWRNGTRFGPMARIQNGTRRSLAEQIIGTGRFIMRFGGGQDLHAATVRALVEAARRHIPHYDRLGAQDRIAALAFATGLNGDDLNTSMHQRTLSRPVELRHAIATLEHARRILNNKHLNDHSRRSHAS